MTYGQFHRGSVMADKSSMTAVGEVTAAEAKLALTELLTDQRFHATDRAKAILSYLGDQYFSNGRDSVKAYAIAVDVLGRPESFDPGTDPIARIEMSRLRSALVQYFEAFGREKPIEIILPKGKYALCFLYRPSKAPAKRKRKCAPCRIHRFRGYSVLVASETGGYLQASYFWPS
ncbi:hypothetical protein HED63_25100 [Ochrobactrum cytisi]|nr:hypothetical protein [Brucella cytisi]